MDKLNLAEKYGFCLDDVRAWANANCGGWREFLRYWRAKRGVRAEQSGLERWL